MLAKVIAWAPTRADAIDRLDRGLNDTDVRGIVSNIPFLSNLITHPDVRANTIDTGFIERHLKALTPVAPAPADADICAAVAAILANERLAAANEPSSPWATNGWMPVGRRKRAFTFKQGTAECKAVLVYGNGPDCIIIDDRELLMSQSAGDGGSFDLTIDGVRSRVAYVIDGHEIYIRTPSGRFELHLVDPFGGDDDEVTGEDRIVAPLPGTVVALLAEVGATLEKGAPILTLEVMKMEQTLRAPYAGVLKSIKYKVGDIVGEGAELAELEATK